MSLFDSLRGMSGTRRFTLLGIVAVAVVAVAMLGTWASRPTYVTLYRDLELEDASAIQEKLSKTDIKFQLAAGGSEIQVPLADLARARVALAKDGTPGGGRPGLELFDKPSWGMTDFTQRVTYQRALEGELARTIGAIHGVRRAQVHLVLSTNSPIRRLERGASASVVLTTDGRGLDGDAIQGIAYIVSNSVEQLSPDNVAIMDDAGRVLSVPTSAGQSVGLSNRQMDIQHSVELHLAAKVDDLLATVVGAGRVRTQVAAQLSFDQVDQTIESFDPDGQVIQNEQRSEDGTSGTGDNVVYSNTYQNSRKLEKIVNTGGNVTRLTVAVLVDDSAMSRRGAPQTDSLSALVRNAIGLDSTRGDQVSIMRVPFGVVVAAPDSLMGKSDGPIASAIGTAEQISRPLIALIAMIALILIAWRAMRPSTWTPPAGALVAAGESNVAMTGAGAMNPDMPGMVRRVAGGNPAEALGRPEVGVKVVRSWLAES
ncbi:MAG: flagellar basal-body MS-ring/collar protein FliF [Gemmatimonadota bacterium]